MTATRRTCWVSKLATLFWAVFASIVAIWASELGSLIEVVNRFGSFFYGSILGVFLLAIGWKRANSTGAFSGLIAGMGVVGWESAESAGRDSRRRPVLPGRRGAVRVAAMERCDRERVARQNLNTKDTKATKQFD